MLDSQEECPECGHYEGAIDEEAPKTETPETQPKAEKHGSSLTAILVSLITLTLICGGGYWGYSAYTAKMQEKEDYENLMETTNPEFYRQFLTDHPQSQYRREVEARMKTLQEELDKWNLIATRGNREELKNYLDTNPGSPYAGICLDKLDSLDWQEVLRQNSEVALEKYMKEHPEGHFIELASEHRNKLAQSRVSDADIALIRSNIETLLTQMSSISPTGISSVLAEKLAFCGRTPATADDVALWAKQHKEKDVIGLHYLINGELKTEKITDTEAITYRISFTMRETINRSDPTKQSEASYNVRIIMNADKKITEISF